MRQGSAVLAMVTALLFSSAALATTWTVDAALPDDSQCGSPNYQCKTIGAALTLALSGDTINVLAGTYNENVTIGGGLTLNGAQANVDACDRPGTGESIVAGAGTLFTLVGPGTIVNGFTFQGGARQIYSNGPIDNVQLLNNRHVDYTGSGVFLDSSGNDISVDQCLLDGTSSTGGSSLHLDTDTFDGFQLTNSCLINAANGFGFFVDGARNVGVSGARSPLFDGNLFEGNQQAMNLGSRGLEGGTISNNTFQNNLLDGIVGGPKDSAITGNVIDGNGRGGILFTAFGNTDPARGPINNTVTENCFTGNGFDDGGSGIGTAMGFFSGDSANHATNAINNNNIEGNFRGALNGNDGTIDMTNNYWGAADGPGGPDGSGSGDGVDGGGSGGSITFSPFLATEAAGAPDCAPAPLPTTSGWMTFLLAVGLMTVLAYGVSRREAGSRAH